MAGASVTQDAVPYFVGLALREVIEKQAKEVARRLDIPLNLDKVSCLVLFLWGQYLPLRIFLGGVEVDVGSKDLILQLDCIESQMMQISSRQLGG